MWFKKKHAETFRVDERLQSVAIIMDGNGRWAKRRMMPRTYGHAQGAAKIEHILEIFREIGVHTVTLYAFSTENWKRPKEEVDTIMDLVYRYLDTVVIRKLKEDPTFSLKFLGDKAALPEKLREKCIEVEGMAQDRPFVCNVALNYGGRDEIVHAAREAVAAGEELTEESISRHLYTSHSPDPDLIIRTGGDMRSSNFLLWQSAYSEFVFTDTLWPDFDRGDIMKAVHEFYHRKRRFGGLDAEDTAKK